MKKILSFVFVFAIALTACAQATPIATATTVPPTATPAPPTATVTATLVPTATATPAPTPTPMDVWPDWEGCTLQSVFLGQSVFASAQDDYPNAKQAQWAAQNEFFKISVDGHNPLIVLGPSIFTVKDTTVYYRVPLPNLTVGIHKIIIANSIDNPPFTTCILLTIFDPNDSKSQIEVNLGYQDQGVCSSQMEIYTNQAAELVYGGRVDAEEKNEAAYLAASTETVKVDGIQVASLSGTEGWDPITREVSTYSKVYESKWTWMLPPLSKGLHKIEVAFGVSKNITIDGNPFTTDQPYPGCVDLTVK